ncbi:hypothetical protein C8R43DRAFT_679528 [Mycena crocata]|nr:hypothetical protein C8R43DRAFT_679528 [Mycena crocata]
MGYKYVDAPCLTAIVPPIHDSRALTSGLLNTHYNPHMRKMENGTLVQRVPHSDIGACVSCLESKVKCAYTRAEIREKKPTCERCDRMGLPCPRRSRSIVEEAPAEPETSTKGNQRLTGVSFFCENFRFLQQMGVGNERRAGANCEISEIRMAVYRRSVSGRSTLCSFGHTPPRILG